LCSLGVLVYRERFVTGREGMYVILSSIAGRLYEMLHRDSSEVTRIGTIKIKSMCDADK